MSTDRDLHRVAADVVIERDGKVLLIERGRPPFKGHWALPGGHVDAGEQVSDAARREIYEETGLSVELTGTIGIYDAPGRDPRGPVITIAYAGRVTDGAAEAGTDAARTRWFPISELPDTLAFDHADIIADHLRTRPETNRL